ncbi:MAG: protein kinase [bacterium]
MSLEFPFCGREKELQELQDAFTERVVKKRGSLQSYLVQGRQGIGKSILVRQFIKTILADKVIAARIPRFGPHNVIEYDCSQRSEAPYSAFMRITKEIQERSRLWRILRRLGMLAIALLPLHDILDDLEKLRNDINSGAKSDDEIRNEENKIFRNYLKMLRRSSNQAPLIIHIENVQWIDDHSLQLLRALVVDDEPIWGMIILEENEVTSPNEQAKEVIRKLSGDNMLTRLPLRTMHKGFEIKILKEVFGPDLFTTSEYEYIFILSEGVPGELAKQVHIWTSIGWLFETGDGWQKTTNFENKIRPPLEKLLDLIITVAQDKEISPREQLLVNNFAREWDIEQDVVASMIDLVLKSYKLGYQIEERLHTGSIGQDAFLAFDEDRNRYIVEYLNYPPDRQDQFVPREVNHPKLLSTKCIIRSDDGVLIVSEFCEGNTLRDTKERADEEHIHGVLKMALQIAEGVHGVHKDKLVHGHLRPESIIRTSDGEFRVAAIDAALFDLAESLSEGDFIRHLAYYSPEQIRGEELTPQSDIYSFGTIMYEMLTGELPYPHHSIQDLKHAIQYDPLPTFENSKPAIPRELRSLLQHCLEKDPQERFENTRELLEGLRSLISHRSQVAPVTTPTERPDQPFRPQLPSRAIRRAGVFAAGAIVLAFLVVAGIRYFKPQPLTPLAGVVLLHPLDQQSSGRATRGDAAPSTLTPEMLRYLIADDLIQSTDWSVVTSREFESLNQDGKYCPQDEIRGTLIRKDLGYEVRLQYRSDAQEYERRVAFNDPVALLTGSLARMTQPVLELRDQQRKASTFTQRWDAFTSFFAGEEAWNRLEVDVALREYQTALDVDPEFVLAKLRLAQVLRFDGQRVTAAELCDSIQPYLSELSHADSLRAEALQARLGGDLRLEINILKQIYETSSTRKEAPYDVAEAYYELCDIKEAIKYYRLALDQDPQFTLAINHLGYCHSHLGEHDQALFRFRQYVELDSTANAYDSWADGLMSAGKLDSAATIKQLGIELRPTTAYLHQSLCYINLLRGKLDSATQNAEQYLDLVAGQPYRVARGKFLRALIAYSQHQDDLALVHCLEGLADFDSADISTRNHDLHWLAGLLYLRLDRPDEARDELAQMEAIIADNQITYKNYWMGLYKYCLHLRACLAARDGDLELLGEQILQFDRRINTKVKNHSSPFDLAFFNTAFAELYLELGVPYYPQAAERLRHALAYNPDYPLAHHLSWRLGELRGDSEQAAARERFSELWRGADEPVRARYGL